MELTNLPDEWWRDIAEAPTYEVSNLGGVRRKSNLKVLVGTITKQGYRQVMLPGHRKRSVHRLVAFAWCAGFSDGLVVNHKNGMRADNRADNLEWVSQAENNRHAYQVLGKPGTSTGKFGEQHPTSKPLIATCIRTGHCVRYASGTDAIRAGFSSSGISHSIARRISHHGGYVWTHP